MNYEALCSEDLRNPEQASKQAELVRTLCDANWKQFQPLFDAQKKIEEQTDSNVYKKQSKISRLELSLGKYVLYADNLTNNGYTKQTFELPEKCILSLHGIPGTIKDFTPIERRLEPSFCRFVHLFMPGLDNQDERRGTYKGSLPEVAELIKEFLDALQINKVCIMMHSLGGYFGKYFAYAHPSRVEALIQIASIPITEWHGWKYMRMMYENTYMLGDGVTNEYLSTDEARDIVTKNSAEFKKDLGEMSRQQRRQYGPVLHFSTSDIMTMRKVTNSFPGGIYEIIHKFRQINPSIPRLIAYSPKDELATKNLYEQEIFTLISATQADTENYASNPQSIRRVYTLKKNSTIGLQNPDFQANFLFRFDDASHYLHFEKASQLSVVIKQFLRGLQQLEISPSQSVRL